MAATIRWDYIYLVIIFTPVVIGVIWGLCFDRT